MKVLYCFQGLEWVLGIGIYFLNQVFDINKRICDYSEVELEKFLHGKAEKIKIENAGQTNMTYEGLMVKFNRLYLSREGEISEATKKN